jgi:HSP90 family molecular chaperone
MKHIFDEYIKNMQKEQEEIYFCVADTYEAARIHHILKS